MLKTFSESQISLESISAFDQRPFRSMLIRKYVYYNSSAFHISKEGKRALMSFQTQDISRKDPTKPLTTYLKIYRNSK